MPWRARVAAGLERPVPLVLMVLVAVVLWGGEYARRDLWEPDEARYAYVAREMRDAGRWLVPHRHGVYYAHKPPLMFWAINAAASVAGGSIDRITTRLPSLVGVLCALWASSRLAARWFGAPSGWRTVGVLLTANLFWRVGAMGQIDALLCGLQMAGIYGLFTAEPGHPRRGLILVASYAAFGLAVLAKGPVGLLVPLGACVAACAAAHELRDRAWWHLAWGSALALVPVGVWLLLVTVADPPAGYLRELLFHQNVGRVTGAVGGHIRGLHYYLVQFPADFLPWSIVLPAALIALRRGGAWSPAVKRCLAWTLFVIVFFTCPSMKRNLYVMLAFPPAAMLVAAGWGHLAVLAPKARAWLAGGLQVFLAVAGASLTVAMVGMAYLPAILARLGSRAPGSLRNLAGVELPAAALVVPAAVFLAGVAWLGCRRTEDAMSAAWFWRFTAVVLAAKIAVAQTVLPAANPLKTPHALAAAAVTELPAGHPLLLYGMNGEIQALYCRARGQAVDSIDALNVEIKRQGRGIVCLSAEDWNKIGSRIDAPGAVHLYRMGGKRQAWYAFDTAAAQPLYESMPATLR
jgi:4-amino-4-deoxy-L-arabinose transferase-like glycosyltransferase